MKKAIPVILLLALCIGSLFIGVTDIHIKDLFMLEQKKTTVMVISRIPRLLSILLSGMGISVAGVIMQMIGANRFLSPTTGSTTEWARLGVLTAVLVTPSATVFQKMGIAFLFAFGGTLLFLYLMQIARLKDAEQVPLVGILFGNVVGAVTTYITYQNDLIQNITSWMQGSFTMILKGRYELLYIGLPLLALALLYADRFTVVAMGKDISGNLGVRYFSTLQIGVVIIALITSGILVTVGSVPFVGIVIPNIVRMIYGDNLRKNLVPIALLGGSFVLLCDIVSRLIIYPFEVPIGISVGIIGCVLFLILLFKGGPREAR